MFVDASAIVALLSGAPEADRLAARLAAAKARFTSGLAVLEACMRLSILLDIDPVQVESRVQRLIAEAEMSVVAITNSITRKAVAALAAYGEPSGHPARLNLAACMSYACAQAYHVPLLCTGNEFYKTDIEVA